MKYWFLGLQKWQPFAQKIKDKFSKFYKKDNEIKHGDDILVNMPCIDGRYTTKSVQSPCTNERHHFI